MTQGQYNPDINTRNKWAKYDPKLNVGPKMYDQYSALKLVNF